MMLYVNECKLEVPEGFLVIELLEKLQYSKQVAIWVNDSQLLQQEYETHVLKNDDKVRIVRPFGGG